MSDMRDERGGVSTYLTEAEAKEFHKIFIVSFLAFTAVAVVAHVLVWMWKPWLQNTADASALLSHGAAVAQAAITTLLA